MSDSLHNSYGTTPSRVHSLNAKDVDVESGQPSSKTGSFLTGQAATTAADKKNQKNLRFTKPPSYASEMVFVTVNLFLLKFYNERFFESMSFFYIAIPMMVYLICILFMNLMEFIKLLHIEELAGGEDDSDALISPKQTKLLIRVTRDLMAYFGVYYLSSQLDAIFVLKEDALENIGNNSQFISAVIMIEISLFI